MDQMDENRMQDEEIIALQDEEGGVIEFRVLDRLTLKGQRYIVVAEVMDEAEADEDLTDEDDPEQDDDGAVMIYRLQDCGDGSESFEPIDDEDELQDVFDQFRVAWDDYEFGDAE